MFKITVIVQSDNEGIIGCHLNLRKLQLKSGLVMAELFALPRYSVGKARKSS